MPTTDRAQKRWLLSPLEEEALTACSSSPPFAALCPDHQGPVPPSSHSSCICALALPTPAPLGLFPGCKSCLCWFPGSPGLTCCLPPPVLVFLVCVVCYPQQSGTENHSPYRSFTEPFLEKPGLFGSIPNFATDSVLIPCNFTSPDTPPLPLLTLNSRYGRGNSLPMVSFFLLVQHLSLSQSLLVKAVQNQPRSIAINPFTKC